LKTSSNHLPSLLSSILFLLAGLLFAGIAAFMGLAALTSFVTGSGIPAQQTVFLAAFGFEAILLFSRSRSIAANRQRISKSLRALPPSG
jgi:hypothetical protein